MSSMLLRVTVDIGSLVSNLEERVIMRVARTGRWRIATEEMR
jgi:hypothetical protein